MAIAANLGFPRIGAKRELKKSLESYWSGKAGEKDLFETCRNLRKEAWMMQKEAGLEHIPSGDFSLYDHVLDTIAMTGAVPSRYGFKGDKVDLDLYFAMARGSLGGVTAMEMTKWFDTNYHYIVPEFDSSTEFRLAHTKILDHFVEARELGFHTRPVIIGPVSFLLLGKGIVRPLSLLDRLLPVYEELLKRLAEEGAEWVQVDEPFLAMDIGEDTGKALINSFERLSTVSPGLKLLAATYFEGLRGNMQTALALPVAALHLDLVRYPDQLETVIASAPDNLILSLGVVDGRNVWRNNLDRSLEIVRRAVDVIGIDRVMVSPSCSLVHSPVDLDLEVGMEGELRDSLSFAKQKLEEIVLLTRALNDGTGSVEKEFDENRRAMEVMRKSPRIHNAEVKKQMASITPEMTGRKNRYQKRRTLQKEKFNFPLFPTTTIGSFPQTKELRKARAAFKSGKINKDEYDAFIRDKTGEAIRFQEEVGLDLLVHGEFERNDMVEYFGERLAGFAITKNGWVQSYGSRCVKPPIIYGDVKRNGSMTVEWSRYAQSLTEKPVKGMLTGPVTILQWSFVRVDQPREVTCRQIALAIRDETVDLEKAGIGIIQIDEPAIREGLPLRREDWEQYLRWAVDAFRLASGGVRDDTQIHTHMCYSEFNDIIGKVAELDADVISIEASRSQMELLKVFTDYRYPNEIGPGVYDIHSPRIPGRDEMENLLKKAVEVLSSDQVWVNPDCGLKTRNWKEVRPALAGMVEAARSMRLIHEQKK